METEHLIPVEQFCSNYQVEFSFIDSLQEYGLIEIITYDQAQFLAKEKLSEVERMMRLHYDLNINLEGIDAISHLLNRVNNLRDQLNILENKLRIYEHE